MKEIHDVASKLPLIQKRCFCPYFRVTCFRHFSHALIPDMQSFVPRIPPANPPPGAPTTHRIIRRKLTMHRNPAPKQAIGVMMASKKFNLERKLEMEWTLIRLIGHE